MYLLRVFAGEQGHATKGQKWENITLKVKRPVAPEEREGRERERGTFFQSGGIEKGWELVSFGIEKSKDI